MENRLTAQELVEQQKRNQEKFIALVQKQEAFAKKNPSGYRRHVKALAWLGYGYIASVLVVTILLIIGIVWVAISFGTSGAFIKILLLLGFFLIAILRSLWVRITPPEGLVLERKDAPKLFEEIDRISAGLDAIKIAKVLINDEMNAAAFQVPMFGLFGPTKNYLIIGLPLLLSMSPDEFRFVIAHEFGHFSGQHGRFGSWAYRLNRTWENLQANLRGNATGSLVLGSFFNWFEPIFAATTFVLRREQEYEADKVGSDLVGTTSAGAALMRLQYVAPHLQKSFWEPLFERTKTEAAPPRDVFLLLPATARGSVEPDFVLEHVENGLKQKTDYDDTHPCLRDRLDAMGINTEANLETYAAPLAEPLQDTAANRFLGDGLEPLLRRVSQDLAARMEKPWAESYAATQQARKEIDELEAALQSRELNQEESLRFARLVGSDRSIAESRALFEAHLEKYPDDPDAIYFYGYFLLEDGDETGIEYLRKAQQMKPEYAVAVIDRIGQFESERENVEALEALKEEMLEARATHEIAKQEARSFDLTDQFMTHGLSEEALNALIEQFRVRTDVSKVYLVRKMLSARPSSPPLCMIVIRKRKRGFEDDDADTKFAKKVVQEIQSSETFMLFAPKQHKPWIKRMSELPGALVYDADGERR